MFVDILNSFQPIQFFMDSPIWVTIVIFGIIGIFRKDITAALKEACEETVEESDKGEPGDEIASLLLSLIVAFIVAIINVIYIFALGYVSLSVLTHKGVDGGFPMVAGLCVMTLLSWGLSALVCKITDKLHEKKS